MEKSFSVKETKENIIIVNKSKFISIIFPINSLEDFNVKLKDVKIQYSKARHYCYAYIINNIYKYSDDGEPSGTAGKVMYETLKIKNLTNVGLIIVRYFGGTLLGSGRLLRTYLKSAIDVVDLCEKFLLKEVNSFKCSLNIEYLNEFKIYLKNNHFIINNISFNDKILIDFYTPLDFKEDIADLFKGKVDVLSVVTKIILKEKE